MQISESIYTHIVPCLADVLTGFGLCVLLEFSRTSPDMHYLLAICIGVVLAVGALSFALPCQKVIPAWVSLCNATYSLVLTLALSLNLLSQLCPPSGKELCLIPVYCLLCVPLMPPSGKALVVQAGAATLLLVIFLLQPASRHVRPSGDVGSGISLTVSMFAGIWLQTFDLHNSSPMLHSTHSEAYRQHRWWRCLSFVCKWFVLLLLGNAGNTLLYSFMYERMNKASDALFLVYGTFLLFSSMQTAAMWFDHLKQVLNVHAKWRLVVRIQHIINALIVAAAWIYPLQLHSLRLIILTMLLGLNLAFSI